MDLTEELGMPGARGFWRGFRAASAHQGNKTFGFLVPYFNGLKYSGCAVRLDLDQMRNGSGQVIKHEQSLNVGFMLLP